MTTQTLKKIVAPSEGLMRRLKLGQKFALIAVVLLVPLGFVTNSYLAVQNRELAFGNKERVGVVAIRPMVELVAAIGDARAAAARGDAPQSATVLAAASQVDGQLSALRGKLDVDQSWTAVKAKMATAAAVTPPAGPQAVDAWAGAGSAAVTLIADTADNSNLTLDPDIDSFYVMDAVTVKIPTLLDTGGNAVDLAAVDAKGRHDDIAIANGTLASTMAGTTTDVQKAVKATRDAQLGSSANGPLSGLTTSVGAISTELAKSSASNVAPAAVVGAAARRDALTLSHALVPHLDRLLQARTHRFAHNKLFVEETTGLALLVALWLFLGFFRSVTEGVHQLIGVLEAVASGDFNQAISIKSNDEVGSVAKALRDPMQRMGSTVAGMVDGSAVLSASSESLSAVSQQMSVAAEETAAQAATVSAAAEQVSHNIQSVSAGSEELGASIQEIAKNTSDAARVASEAVSVAEETNETVTKLGESSAEIGEVIKVITLIAEQTNLLALNATIEAARAGDAGKGFAVVANEVKALARKTAKSSDEIGRKIESIQGDTRQAVAAIGKITAIIRQINDIQTVIAASVEEQAVTTREIGRSVTEAASGSSEIARNITGVAEAARSTTQGAAETHRSAEELARLAGELMRLVGQFSGAATAGQPRADGGGEPTSWPPGSGSTPGDGTFPFDGLGGGPRRSSQAHASDRFGAPHPVAR